MGWALLGSLSTGLSFCCQQKGRCLCPGRACPSSLSRQERDGKLELIRLKTIPAVGTKQGKRKPKQSERTAGGRGVPARSPPSPGAFFRAACAKSEATPSVTDRDVNPSAPEPCHSASATPSSPPKKTSVWLLRVAGAGGWERIPAWGLLADVGCSPRSAGELQRWKEGRGEEGRSHCHHRGLGVAGVPEIPVAHGGSPAKGKEKGRPARLSRGVALFLELFS